MSDDNDDLEDYWNEVRPKDTALIVQILGPSHLASQLRLASTTAAKALLSELVKSSDDGGHPAISQSLEAHCSRVADLTYEHLLRNFRGMNLAGLIEICLEGQGLSPSEIVSFLHALPNSLLDRILTSVVQSGTGVHALMALEKRRRHREASYVVESIGNSVVVTFRHDDKEVHFNLYDTFNLDNA